MPLEVEPPSDAKGVHIPYRVVMLLLFAGMGVEMFLSFRNGRLDAPTAIGAVGLGGGVGLVMAYLVRRKGR